MNFFDYIKNESFFKPLTLKYHRVYYDCILKLIDKSKELPVLYETDARDCITFYIKNLNIQRTESEIEAGLIKTSLEDAAADAALQETQITSSTSSSILSLFYDSGWLLPREIGRNGEYVVNVSGDCRRFMDFLRKLTEKAGEGTMSNRIFAMYDIIKSAFEENSARMDRPYMNLLVPLLDNESELKNELLDLKESIGGIMKMVIVFQDVNDFGQYILKDEMLDQFFNEYFFVKNNGMIPTQLSYIRNGLRILRQEDTLLKMAAECAEKLQMSPEEARDRVERYFAELQYFLDTEYEDNMELIDKRINNYYNLANTRIMLMASNGIRLESVMNDFLNRITVMPENLQKEALEKVAACTRITSQKYVGYKSFEKIKRVKNEGENIGLSAKALSEEEKQKETDRLLYNGANHYSVSRVDEFLKKQLENEKELSLKGQNIKTKEEVLMYAAAMLYARNEEFPYDVILSDEMLIAETADINNMRIMKNEGVKQQ